MKYNVLLHGNKVVAHGILDIENSITLELNDDEINFLQNNSNVIYDGSSFSLDAEKILKRNNINVALEKIDILKSKLNNTDYQITKCYEAFMRQQPLPYNLEELSTQRDSWRAEINQLEEELKEYEI
jgi:hypothetical protein